MDRRADWLTRGRVRGLTAGQRRRMAAGLNRLRANVLRGARLRAGERVLDVGAGTGLIALGFDERDLVRWFVEAGFSTIRLQYELSHVHALARQSPVALAAGLGTRPNPQSLSYEEGARAVLGDAADQYLVRYVRFLRAQPRTRVSAAAYVAAVR